jgi:MerR family mercuric resistance operon transcriptional regulator
MKTMLPIREIAARSGASVHTLRYYEREGLLPRPDRSSSGYRLYPPEAVRRIRLVRVLRSLGFRVRELRSLAGVFDNRFPRASVRARLRVKRDEVGARLRELERSWKLLDALQTCRCRGDCVLIARLLDGTAWNPAGAARPPRAKKRSDPTKEKRT